MKSKIKTIETNTGKIFKIELPSNPTTGYSWQPVFNKDDFILLSNYFQTESELIGAGSLEIFEFKSKKTGRLKIKMLYKRAWEKLIEKELDYDIIST